MALLFHTTEYKPGRAQAEIQRLLMSIQARSITLEYAADGSVNGMGFEIETPVGRRSYVLPVRTAEVKEVLAKQGVLVRSRGDEHAAAVAWRTLLEWLKVQVAMMETHQAEPAEVMLPYMLVLDERGRNPRPLYEQFKSDQAALGEGKRG
jgi:hypothetical protein